MYHLNFSDLAVTKENSSGLPLFFTVTGQVLRKDSKSVCGESELSSSVYEIQGALRMVQFYVLKAMRAMVIT